MRRVRDVIDFLGKVEGIETTWLGSVGELDQSLLRINTDQGAEQGDLAWISPRQASIRPDSVSGFHGSLLIGPKGVAVEGIPFLACDRPKLAFILAANQFFSDSARIAWPSEGRFVHQDAVIHQSAVLAPGAIIGSGVVIGERVLIGPNSVIANAVISRNVTIGASCSIGLPGFGYERDEAGTYWRFPHMGRVLIGENAEIGSCTCIDRGAIGDTVIAAGVKLDNLVHIAHNVTIGANSLVIANSMIGGSATLDRNVWVAPSVSIMNQIHIGEAAVLGMGAVVIKDVCQRVVVVGNPAKPLRKGTGNG